MSNPTNLIAELALRGQFPRVGICGCYKKYALAKEMKYNIMMMVVVMAMMTLKACRMESNIARVEYINHIYSP